MKQKFYKPLFGDQIFSFGDWKKFSVATWRLYKKVNFGPCEPTILRDLVGRSNHWATGDSMVSKGQFMGLDWNHITRLHSQVMTGTNELTNSITLSV